MAKVHREGYVDHLGERSGLQGAPGDQEGHGGTNNMSKSWAWTTFTSQSKNQKQILVGHQVLEGWGAGGLVRS